MQINDNNYKEYLIGKSVVEVSGESCANCLTLMPILNELSKKMNFILHHIEAAEDTKKLLEMFEIRTVPTILVLNGTKVIASSHGYQPEEILELWLDAKLNEE